MVARLRALKNRLNAKAHLYSPFDQHILLERSVNDPRTLSKIAASLAFIAGAINAGGFLLLRYSTSHVTGTTVRLSSDIGLGDWQGASGALVIVLSFLFGAMTTAFLVAFGRRRRFRGKYAFSLAVESGLLLVFGLSNPTLANDPRLVQGAIILLSFIMGMHNALFTKISQAVVRTTHMTGVLTDFGIELSRLLYYNRRDHVRTKPIIADRQKLALHALLLVSFISGGVIGTLAFQHFGFIAMLPIAAFLLLLSQRYLIFHIRSRFRLWALKRA